MVLKVSAHPVRADAAQIDLSAISAAAARFEPEVDPAMKQARRELARAGTIVPPSGEEGEL